MEEEKRKRIEELNKIKKEKREKEKEKKEKLKKLNEERKRKREEEKEKKEKEKKEKEKEERKKTYGSTVPLALKKEMEEGEEKKEEKQIILCPPSPKEEESKEEKPEEKLEENKNKYINNKRRRTKRRNNQKILSGQFRKIREELRAKRDNEIYENLWLIKRCSPVNTPGASPQDWAKYEGDAKIIIGEISKKYNGEYNKTIYNNQKHLPPLVKNLLNINGELPDMKLPAFVPQEENAKRFFLGFLKKGEPEEEIAEEPIEEEPKEEPKEEVEGLEDEEEIKLLNKFNIIN